MAITAPANFFPPAVPTDAENTVEWARQFTLAVTAHFRRIGAFTSEGIPNEPYAVAVATAGLPMSRTITGSSSILVTDNGASSTLVLSVITSGLPYAIPTVGYANTGLLGSSNTVMHANATLPFPSSLKTAASAWNLDSSETSHIFGGNFYVLTPSNGATSVQFGAGLLVDGGVACGNAIAAGAIGLLPSVGLFAWHALTNTAGNALQFTMQATTTGASSVDMTGAGGNLIVTATGAYTGNTASLAGLLQLSGAGTMDVIDGIVSEWSVGTIAIAELNLFRTKIGTIVTPATIGRGYYHEGWGGDATTPWSFYSEADPAFIGGTADETALYIATNPIGVGNGRAPNLVFRRDTGTVKEDVELGVGNTGSFFVADDNGTIGFVFGTNLAASNVDLSLLLGSLNIDYLDQGIDFTGQGANSTPYLKLAGTASTELLQVQDSAGASITEWRGDKFLTHTGLALFEEKVEIRSSTGTGATCLVLTQSNTGATEGAHLQLSDKSGNIVTPVLGDIWRFGTATKLVSSTFVLTYTGDAGARSIIFENSQTPFTLSVTPTTLGTFTMTIPNRPGELIHDGMSGTQYNQTMQHKRFIDANDFFVNEADNSKGMRFQVDEIDPNRTGDNTLAGGHVVINIPDLDKTPVEYNMAVLEWLQTFTVPQTFTRSATRGNINLVVDTGDPSATANGDLWYNSTTGKLRGHEGGAAVDLIGGADETEGGTGQTTYALGDMLYASAADVLSKLAQGNTTGAIQILEQTSTIPAWTTVDFEHTFILEAPTSSEDTGGFWTPNKVEVIEVRGVLKGGVTACTIDVGHSATMNSGFDSVLTAPKNIVSVGGGTIGTLQTDGSEDIPAGHWVWLKTSAGGGAGWLSVTVKMRRIF